MSPTPTNILFALMVFSLVLPYIPRVAYAILRLSIRNKWITLTLIVLLGWVVAAASLLVLIVHLSTRYGISLRLHRSRTRFWLSFTFGAPPMNLKANTATSSKPREPVGSVPEQGSPLATSNLPSPLSSVPGSPLWQSSDESRASRKAERRLTTGLGPTKGLLDALKTAKTAQSPRIGIPASPKPVSTKPAQAAQQKPAPKPGWAAVLNFFSVERSNESDVKYAILTGQFVLTIRYVSFFWPDKSHFDEAADAVGENGLRRRLVRLLAPPYVGIKLGGVAVYLPAYPYFGFPEDLRSSAANLAALTDTDRQRAAERFNQYLIEHVPRWLRLHVTTMNIYIPSPSDRSGPLAPGVLRIPPQKIKSEPLTWAGLLPWLLWEETRPKREFFHGFASTLIEHHALNTSIADCTGMRFRFCLYFKDLDFGDRLVDGGPQPSHRPRAVSLSKFGFGSRTNPVPMLPVETAFIKVRGALAVVKVYEPKNEDSPGWRDVIIINNPSASAARIDQTQSGPAPAQATPSASQRSSLASTSSTSSGMKNASSAPLLTLGDESSLSSIDLAVPVHTEATRSSSTLRPHPTLSRIKSDDSTNMRRSFSVPSLSSRKPVLPQTTQPRSSLPGLEIDAELSATMQVTVQIPHMVVTINHPLLEFARDLQLGSTADTAAPGTSSGMTPVIAAKKFLHKGADLFTKAVLVYFDSRTFEVRNIKREIMI